MDDLRRELDPIIADWTTSARSNMVQQQMEWSNLVVSSQGTSSLGGMGMVPQHDGTPRSLNRQYLGLALDRLQQQGGDLQPVIHTPPPNQRLVQSARQLLRSGSDMTASRKGDRHTFTHQTLISSQDITVHITRCQYNKIEQTMKLLSDQIKDIEQVIQKMMPVLNKMLTGGRKEDINQAMLDELLPRIQQNLSHHLHNVQNKLLTNIQTTMNKQEVDYQQLCEQVQFLNAGHSQRDQNVLSMLGQLSDLIQQKEKQYDRKLEEMKQEMNKRMEQIESKIGGQTIQDDAK
eukprot:TRINITY_DN2124_c0_g3_i1.p1 TRINITY_DN2124_c0_g3~~TRINITY_DN2124_c0_g3_i1.p1  ORF type:complete len:332 (+),score=36.09 TRINITY_DN2124_c0_g3_i1:128-997(+)